MQIEGRNAVLESLRSNREFDKLLVQHGINKDEKVRQILSKAKNRDIDIIYVSKIELNKLSTTGVHQGFIAIAKEKEKVELENFIEHLYEQRHTPFLVFIREALYEHNIGAITRTAECAGANGIILPPKIKMTAESIRASAGAAEHIEIFNENLFNAIKICKEKGMKIIGIEVTGNKYYYDEDLTGPTLLIIGGEDRSISMEIQKKCDIIVKIPLLGSINSLNMSVAASIVIFDKVRQELSSK